MAPSVAHVVVVFLVNVATSAALTVPLSAAKPAVSLAGMSLTRAADDATVDLGAALSASEGKTMLVFGAHAADFNTIEYMQRVRHWQAALQERGVDRTIMVVNGDAAAAAKLASLVDLPKDVEVRSPQIARGVCQARLRAG